MTKQEQQKIKKSLLALVKKNKTYQKETDDQLIDSYVFNLVMMEDAKQDIIARGVSVQIGNDRTFFQKNFSVNTYHDCQRLVNELAKKLGIEKEKLVVDQKTNAKDNLMSLING